MAALDPVALEQELTSLRRQRFEASQRVRASRQPPVAPTSQIRGAGAGDARPPLGGSREFGPAERGFGGPPSARGEGPRGPRDGPPFGRFGGPPIQRGPFGGGPDGREGGHSGRAYGESRPAPYSRDRDAAGPGAGSKPVAPAKRRAVQSVVVGAKDQQPEEHGERPREDRDGPEEDERRWGSHWREGHERGRGQLDDEGIHRGDRDRHRQEDEFDDPRAGGRGVKRPPPEPEQPPPGAGAAATDPDSRKRARRLLGRALLGTLQKFRQEDAQFQASEAAARRAELARKAEEKAAAESERLRRQAADDRARKRQEELSALMDLNLATDIKVLELLYAKKLARRRKLAGFLRADGVPGKGKGGQAAGSALTHSQPQPVFWVPAKHCEATLAVKERQERELKDWEEALLAELEQEKEGLRKRAQMRRDGIVERRERAAAERAAGGQAQAPGGAEEEDAEDHEAFDAVELDAHADEHVVEAEVAEAEVDLEADLEQGDLLGEAGKAEEVARDHKGSKGGEAPNGGDNGTSAEDAEMQAAGADGDDADAHADADPDA